MNLLLLVIFVVFCPSSNAFENESNSSEAVIDCGRVHNVELMKFPNSSASFSNSKCALHCVIGNLTLPVDFLHEGKSCPEDSVGFCHKGQCIGGQEEALRDCSLKHNLDFHLQDHQGTAFTNDQCTLKCVLSGMEWSANQKHEGLHCPVNPNGICRSGVCIGSNVTQKPATTTQTVSTKPSIEPFSASKIKFLNISLVSTIPPLTENSRIELDFIANYSNSTSASNSFQPLCYFYGSTTKGTSGCSAQAFEDTLARLKPNSRLSIDWINEKGIYTEHSVNLFEVLGKLYQLSDVKFDELERYIIKCQIVSKDTLKNSIATMYSLLGDLLYQGEQE